MNKFEPRMSQQHVRFGAGLRHHLCDAMDYLGTSRAVLLTTPAQSNLALELAEDLGVKVVGMYSKAAMHTPVDVTEDALSHILSVNADCLIAIGGGSTTGLGKALALRTDLPQIVVPTTYAGSEATPILGQTENGLKTTITDNRVLPEVIYYDPELVVSLPTGMTATSGLNAMAHAVEGLYAKDRNAETTGLAIEGLQSFANSLPKVLEAPEDLTAREETLKGAYACGAVLGRVGMALHHKLCHTLGGSFDMPHAQTHAVILPHATAYNEIAVPDLLSPVTEIFGGTSPGQSLWKFSSKIGSPMTLRELGMTEEDLARAADIAVTKPYWNPREITRGGILNLLKNAWAGHPPS